MHIITLIGYYQKTAEDIDWQSVEEEVTNLYTTWNGDILDFSNLNIDKIYITDFGRSLDTITSAVHNKEIYQTVDVLANIYGFLPQYTEGYPSNANFKSILYTKYYLLKSYSLLYTDNWKLIGDNLIKAINAFYPNIGAQENQGKELQFNKAYVALNELKNSIEKQDKELFDIKYQLAIEALEQCM